MLFPEKNAKELSEKRDNDSKSQLSACSSHRRFLNMIKSSSKAINILHLAFAFSMLVVLAVNITVLIYAFYDINLISDMSLPISIGKSGKDFQRIGYLSRMIYVATVIKSNDPATALTFQEYKEKLADLENIYWNVTMNLKIRNSCLGQSILTDEAVNLWRIDENGVYKKKSTLIDTIAAFIKIGKSFLSELNNTGNGLNDMSFLLLNGYGESIRYCNNSLYDIIDYQKSMMSSFKTDMIILLLLGIALLIICILIMIPFYYTIIKIENNLWNTIRKNAYSHYFELKQIIMERLKYAHFQADVTLNEPHLSMKPYTFKSYWKYAWRTLIFLAFSLLFSIINITYLYEKCADYLLARPEVLKTLINIQVLYTSLNIWTTEISMTKFGLPILDQLSSMFPFSDNENEFLEIVSKLDYSNSAIRKNECADVLSENIKAALYEYDKQYSADYLAYGIYSSKLSIMADAYSLSFYYPDYFMWRKWIAALQELDYNFDSFIDETDKYSQSVIDNQMKIIVAVLIAFILFSFALYLGLYLVFFRREKKYFQKINAVMKIMP
ncbi:unnamed protein product [Blepharisma stoltei]|uniref:Uncharacterized protein n=1 Tax=Blepharisma stoltei TaxID=1481888 RepID=A0AAU9ICE4_9CILI|nr:unnamed protein product [Blepharisma stoltei]